METKINILVAQEEKEKLNSFKYYKTMEKLSFCVINKKEQTNLISPVKAPPFPTHEF